MANISDNDLKLLNSAMMQLERPGLANKLANAVGTPIEKLLDRLPESIQGQIDGVTEEALMKALRVAVKTLGQGGAEPPWKMTHKVIATLSGATGGLFGAPALFAELPVTTVIMMRSIADIARSEGEDLRDPAVCLACLEVFALGSGGRQTPDKALEIVGDSEHEAEFIHATYFMARAALAQQVTAAAEILAKGSTAQGGTLARLISRIASRFGIAVSEKAAAQAVPIIGAIGGGLINMLFIDHFQDVAEAHFTVRRLERQYGEQQVRQEYERLAERLRR